MKNNNSKKNSRREFLKNGTLAASSFFIVPRYVLGGNGYTSPSDKINIAGIGVGGKGTSDLWYASDEGKENVVALCDVDMGEYTKKSRDRFPKANFYQDFREMFDKQKDIDAVTISIRTMFMQFKLYQPWTREFMYMYKNL